jgi:hypothetical protein
MAPPVGKYQVPIVDRFWARVQKSDGCWEWTGAVNSRNGGYGVIGISGSRKLTVTHRLSWEIHHGPIPDGLWVLHRCDNRKCCNPEHLFLGTHADNMRDMTAKGRQANQNTEKPECKYGHAYTLENTRLYAGRRWCRQCARERQQRIRDAVAA